METSKINISKIKLFYLSERYGQIFEQFTRSDNIPNIAYNLYIAVPTIIFNVVYLNSIKFSRDIKIFLGADCSQKLLLISVHFGNICFKFGNVI